MKIVCIEKTKTVKKTKEELVKERAESPNDFYVSTIKKVELKEPIYIVEMSAKEIQLVSFYLELEKRKPIMNVKLDTKVGQ